MKNKGKKEITVAGFIVLIVFLAYVLVQFLRLRFIQDKSLLILITYWLACIYINKLSNRVSISIGLFFLFLLPFFVYYQKELFSQETGILAFIFIACGIFQQFFILLKEKDQSNNLK